MSHEAQTWAYRQTVGAPAAKAVLLLLASYADEAYECFPKHEHIASVLEMSERTVQRAMDKLDDDGWIERRRARRNGKLGVTRYRLCVERRAADSASALPDNVAGGDHRTLCPSLPDSVSVSTGHSVRSESVRESVKESLRESAGASEGQEGASDDPADVRAAHGSALKQPKAVAQAESAELPDAALLDELKRGHPATAADSLPKIERAWCALGARQRQAAHRHMADWIHYVRSELRQGHLPRLSTYLAERRWQHLPDSAKGKAAKAESASVAAETPDRCFVAAFSRPWWWLFWTMVDQIAAGEAGLRRMLARRVALAKTGVGWRVEPERLVGIEAAAETTLVAMPTDGDAVAAICSAARTAAGVDLPVPDRPGWMWVRPEQLGGAAAGGADGARAFDPLAGA